uniref:Klotho beta n=1 Tax=Taeniopygia guttata TaxID=59729 RepID=A0A674H4Q2_TAEGU
VSKLVRLVLLGFRKYKLKSVMPHYSINKVLQDNGNKDQMRTFQTTKHRQKCRLQAAISMAQTQAQLDCLILHREDVQLVKNSRKLKQQRSSSRNKNMRGNLNAIYISKKITIRQASE